METARRDHRWRRDARRALRHHLDSAAGPQRRVPGAGIVDALRDGDLVVIEGGTASVWLVGERTGLHRAGFGSLLDVFDRVTVIVPEAAVASAIGSCAAQIGVHALGHVAGRPTLLPVREAAPQAAHDAATLGKLLWRDELAAILTSCGRSVPPLATRALLLDQLLACCSPAEARQKVLEHLLR